MRDVVRCRETLQREVVTSRHDILTFLARRGFIYRGGVHWRPAHYTWLRQLMGTTSARASEDRLVFGEYFALLEYKLSRRDALDQHIAAFALIPAYAPAVAALQCFRGLQVHSAMVLATEVVDWRRFASPRQLMAYLGFVPREHFSGSRERRGSITKAGNFALSACPRAGGVGVSLAPEDWSIACGAPTRPIPRRDAARVEGATARVHHVPPPLAATRAADRGRRRRARTRRLSVGRDARSRRLACRGR